MGALGGMRELLDRDRRCRGGAAPRRRPRATADPGSPSHSAHSADPPKKE